MNERLPFRLHEPAKPECRCRRCGATFRGTVMPNGQIRRDLCVDCVTVVLAALRRVGAYRRATDLAGHIGAGALWGAILLTAGVVALTRWLEVAR